ncbi:MAG: hypothetical protein FGM52_12210 [Mycobacterium sp.]|nr:hypothetical protein [Mycobacterium sp.]
MTQKRNVVVLTVALTTAAFLGTGSASADNEYKGRTYEQAASQISQYATVKIRSRVGDQLPTDQCVVVGNKWANFLDSSGNKGSGVVLVDLNCFDPVAGGGGSGASVASPEGKKVAKDRAWAASLSKNYADSVAAGKEPWCGSIIVASDCMNFCSKVGTCSDDLLSYLGG